MMAKKENLKKEKKQDEKKETCFIIMPITTPSAMKDKYDGGENHFKYVLEQLFVPAINRINMKPIPPETKGSNVIHGDIIEKLEDADLVLCDMSILNPNVFFELGIRTSLNKPVVLVSDDLTKDIPFDTLPIKHHKYSRALRSYNQTEEVNLLVKHIQDTVKISNKKNPMWKYFSLRSTAQPAERKEGIAGELDYLKLQMETLNKKLDNLPLQISPGLPDYDPTGIRIPTYGGLNPTQHISLTDPLREKIEEFLKVKDISVFTLSTDLAGDYHLDLYVSINQSLIDEITKYVEQLGRKIIIKLMP